MKRSQFYFCKKNYGHAPDWELALYCWQEYHLHSEDVQTSESLQMMSLIFEKTIAHGAKLQQKSSVFH